MKTGKAVILHSGGLDSTVCLLLALEKKRDVLSIGVDYGQRHRIELDFAARQCEEYNVPRRVLRVDWDKPEVEIPEGRTVDRIRGSVSPAFLPGRNIVFLSLACAEAGGIGASEVWIGVNALDYSGYPDCRPSFIEAYNLMLSEGIPEGPRVVTPLISMTKPQIAAEAIRLGINKDDTWSCYQPKFSGKGILPCNRCDACVLHEYAWSEAELTKERNV